MAALTSSVEVGPEQELLLSSMGLSFPQDAVGAWLTRVDRRFDSSRFLQQVQHHRVNRFVLEGLSSSEVSWKNGELNGLRNRLNKQLRISTTQAIHLARRIPDIHRGFEEGGVRYLLVKGPALSQLLYGNPFQREFGDLDILVDPDHLDGAKEALRRLGFRAGGGMHGRIEPPWHRNYLDEDSRIVELHSRLDRHAVDWPDGIDGLFERRRPVDVGGCPIPTLGDRDQVVYLALHGVRHRWRRLQWVQDLRSALSRLDVGAREVLDASEHYRVHRRVLISFAVLDLLDDGVIQEVSPRDHLNRGGRRLVGRMLATMLEGEGGKENPVRRVLTDIQLADSGDMLGHILRTVQGVVRDY